jgi:hypothetical protein
LAAKIKMARLLFHLMAGVIDLGVGWLVFNGTLTVWAVYASFTDRKTAGGALTYYGLPAVAACTLGSMYFTHVLCLKYGV